MEIVVVSGSFRDESESRRAADYVAAEIKKDGHNVSFIDLHETPISLDPSVIWGGKDDNFNAMAETITKAEAYVIVTPEWAGMASPALKNWLVFVGAMTAHKPALIVTASSTRGGAYPVAELKLANKNNHIIWVPEHVILRDVESLLKDDEPTTKEDIFIRKRITYGLKVLYEYGKALRPVRESGVLDLDSYPHGM